MSRTMAKPDEKGLAKVSDSKVLLPLNISQEMVKTLGEIYNPIFSNVRIYGDVAEPMFVAKDVQKLLQLTDLGYKGDSRFDDELERRKLKVQTNGGPQELVVLTEQGLYKAIFASVAPVAKQFQRFITLIMVRLRTKGVVTIDQALKDYKEDYEKEKKRALALENQLDEEHAQLLLHKSAEERYYNQWLDMQMRAARLEEKAKHAGSKDANALENQLQKLREKYMKPLYILLIKPPKDVEDDYQYDWESEDPNEDDQCVYALSNKEEKKTGTCVATVYIHKETKLEDIHEKLRSFELQVKKNKGKEYYVNAYATSIDELKRIINEMTEL